MTDSRQVKRTLSRRFKEIAFCMCVNKMIQASVLCIQTNWFRRMLWVCFALFSVGVIIENHRHKPLKNGRMQPFNTIKVEF